MPKAPTPSQLWQSYCNIETHLKALAAAVLGGNASAALQFAMQTEGVIDALGTDTCPLGIEGWVVVAPSKEGASRLTPCTGIYPKKSKAIDHALRTQPLTRRLNNVRWKNLYAQGYRAVHIDAKVTNNDARPSVDALAPAKKAQDEDAIEFTKFEDLKPADRRHIKSILKSLHKH